MKVNVYLPDDIGERAKRAELNLSGILREAVIGELDRIAALAELEGDMNEWELSVLDDEGRDIIGTFTGKALNDDETVFATDDGRILFHDEHDAKIGEIDIDDLEDLLPAADYVAVMHTLGEIPKIAI